MCSNFAEARSGIDSNANYPANDRLDPLEITTENSQGPNECEMTAVNVMQLILPVVKVHSSTMINTNCAVQVAKIEKIYSAVRLNDYAIDIVDARTLESPEYMRRVKIYLLCLYQSLRL